MSGSPKYTAAELAERERKKLEEQRRREAIREEKRRQEAAERERQRIFQERKEGMVAKINAVAEDIRLRRTELYDTDASTLEQRCQEILSEVTSAQQEEQVAKKKSSLAAIQREIDQCIRRKQRDDVEKERREAMALLIYDMDELVRHCGHIDAANADHFDATGRVQVEHALHALRQAVDDGNVEACQTPLQVARKAIEKHEAQVAADRAAWEAQFSAAQHVAGELQALYAGIQQDPVVMRWFGQEVADMAKLITQCNVAIRDRQLEIPAALLHQAQEAESRWVKEANLAQLQADQRNYIADAIAQSLEALGFFVSPVQEETPGHPLTPLIIQARNAGGQGVHVSVPVDGEVWYDVNGFEMKIEPAANGGSAHTCDAAEGVLEQLHMGLAEASGVQMSELQWEGKGEPIRVEKGADELPVSGQQINQRGGYR